MSGRRDTAARTMFDRGRTARRGMVGALAVTVAATVVLAPGHAWAASADGAPDSAFASNTGTGFGTGAQVTPYSVALQSDGSIVAVGRFDQIDGQDALGVARLGSDGTPDTAFSTNTGTGFSGTPFAVGVQSDDKIIVGGDIDALAGQAISYIARLGSDGTPDTAFTTNTFTGFDDRVYAVAVQPDDKIVVGGSFFPSSVAGRRIARLNPDGTPDTTFNGNTGTGFNSAVRSIAVQDDDKIVVGGSFFPSSVAGRRIARLNPDGTPDTTFNGNTGTGFNSAVRSIAVQDDGKIVVGGSFTFVDGVAINRIARLNPDGTPDTTFNGNTGTGFNSTVNSVALQADGGILAGGAFTDVNGVARNYIARLNADGTPDTAFSTELTTTFPDTGVRAIAVQADGGVIITGDFTDVDGVASNRIARLVFGGGGGSGTGGSRSVIFRFQASTGGTCLADVEVALGRFDLPPASVACTPEGTELVGWSIPGQDANFSPGGTVIAIADQTFTAVAKHPTIAITYDANVGYASADSSQLVPCLSPDGTNLNTARNAPWTTVETRRLGTLATAPPCAPAGLSFAGWTDQPTVDGIGQAAPGAGTYAGGQEVPARWNRVGPDPINAVHLYALWR